MSDARKLAVAAFIFILGLLDSRSPARARPCEDNEPSAIKRFLTATKKPSIERQTLGRLAGRGKAKATFAAVIVSSPEAPSIRMKGLEVRLEDAERAKRVYLDDNLDEDHSLEHFQKTLASLVFSKGQIFENWRADKRADPKAMSIVGADNWQTRSEGENEGWTNVMNAGWYRRGDEYGVVIKCYDAPFLFPDADLAPLVDIIAAGRHFLESH